MQILYVLILSLLLAQPATANDQATTERQALLQIDRHLVELESLIETAEATADPDTRIRFRYDWLRDDIAHLRRGVQAHIHQPLATKRATTPLRRDYRR